MSRPGSPDPWRPPWRTGLSQEKCRAADCRKLVVACTLTDGLCAQCAGRPGALQMTLGLSA